MFFLVFSKIKQTPYIIYHFLPDTWNMNLISKKCPIRLSVLELKKSTGAPDR